jgi:hypothetical protein
MANKNPERPEDLDEIISHLLNPKKPKETQKEKNKRIAKEVSKYLSNS